MDWFYNHCWRMQTLWHLRGGTGTFLWTFHACQKTTNNRNHVSDETKNSKSQLFEGKKIKMTAK